MSEGRKNRESSLSLNLDLSDPTDTGQMFGYCNPRVRDPRLCRFLEQGAGYEYNARHNEA